MSPELIQLFPESPLIYHPHYMGESKERLRAIVRFKDGRLSELEVNRNDENSPFLRDILAQYSEEEIEANSVRENRMREAREERDRREKEDKERDEHRAILFRAKTQALEIAAVKDCADPSLLQRIRKAKSETEVYSLTALAMMQSQPAVSLASH